MKATVKNFFIRAAAGLSLLSVLFINACDDSNPFTPPAPRDRVFYGIVEDAEGNPLPNVLLSFYNLTQINNRPPVETAVSGDDGTWSATLTITGETGYDVVFSRSGYSDLIAEKYLSYSLDTTDIGSVKLPVYDFDALYRVVVTWKSENLDLDAHLTGPADGGERFHLYWNNRQVTKDTGETIAKLEFDNRANFGPEIVTIYDLTPGLFRYSIHNYSADRSTEDFRLYQSGATVRIFGEDGLRYTYEVKGTEERTDSIANAWRVFELDGSSGEFSPVDQLLNNVAFDDNAMFKPKSPLR